MKFQLHGAGFSVTQENRTSIGGLPGVMKRDERAPIVFNPSLRRLFRTKTQDSKAHEGFLPHDLGFLLF